MMVFEALAEPARRAILDALIERPRCVTELVGLLGMPQPNVSKHLRALRAAGLVGVRKDGRRRWYELRRRSLDEVAVWLLPYEQLRQARVRALQRQHNWNRMGPAYFNAVAVDRRGARSSRLSA